MDKNVVVIKKDEAVATIVMNRPEAMNALNLDMINDLVAALKKAEEDDSVRVIILTGEGKSFCSGGDLSIIKSFDGPVTGRELTLKAGSITSTIMKLKKPVVAMVNGTAAGAGFNIALACDIVFCSRSARMIQSFSGVGLISDCGGTYLLPRVVGLHKAKELMFTAETISAEQALSLNIANQVVDDAMLAEETYKYASKLAMYAPLSIAYMKGAVNGTDSRTLEEALELEANLQGICGQTEDCQEGISSFLEKRHPNFKGA